MKKGTTIIIATALTCILSVGAYLYITKDNQTEAKPQDTQVMKPETSKPEEPKQETPKFPFKEGIELTSEDINIPVLYYHAINPNEENTLILHPDKFREQLQYLLDSGYTPLTLEQVYNYLVNGAEIPKKSTFITLDDGYVDNYTNAYPILKELGIPATIFMQTDRIDGPGSLTKDQMREMSQNGIDIMSHTISHPSLKKLSYEEQLKEVSDSKKVLEEILEKPVYAISYPFGDYNNDTLKAVKEAGYTIAFRTNEKMMDKGDKIYELDRIYINSKKDFNYFKRSLEKTKKN